MICVHFPSAYNLLRKHTRACNCTRTACLGTNTMISLCSCVGHDGRFAAKQQRPGVMCTRLSCCDHVYCVWRARDLLECMLHLAIRMAASGQKSRIPASRIGLSTGYFSSLRLLASTTVWVRCNPSPEGVAETCQVPWTATHVPSTVATRRCFGSTCNTT